MKGFEPEELLNLYHKRGLCFGMAGGEKGGSKGQLLYFMQHGIKARNNVMNSRGDRWVHGKAKDNLFRPVLYSEDLNHVVITEGETDAIAVAIAYLRRGKPIPLILGVPGAGVKPTRECLYFHLRHKPSSIVTCFDNDPAGIKGQANLIELLKEHSIHNAIPRTHLLREGDICKELQRNGAVSVTDILEP